MVDQQLWHRRSAYGAAWAALLIVISPCLAADDKLDSSLKVVPADAAFFSTSLRNREQFDAMINSRAFAKLRDLPLVQMGWKKMMEEGNKPNGPIAQFEAFRKQPENQQLLDLLVDMFSTEVFMFGAENCVSLIEVAGQINSAMTFGPLMGQFPGQGRGKDPGEMQAKAILRALADNSQLIRIPDLVLGFKVSKAEPAEKQLKRLEALLKQATANEPMMKGRIKTEQIGGHPFLTLTFDGKMIPWEKAQMEKFETTPGDLDGLIKKLKELTLTISLGVRNNYLVLAIGASTAQVAKLGTGAPLADRPEFKPLAKFAGEKITDIGYASKSMMEYIASSSGNFNAMSEKVKEALKLAPVPDEMKKRVEKDIQEFAKDMQSFMPKPGASMSFTFSTSKGQESYSYNWSEHTGLDGSKPLSLLQHVGGSPILAAVGRTKYNPEGYRQLVKWAKKLNAYVEEFVVPMLGDAGKDQFEQFTKFAYPLLKRFDETNSKLLLPAFKDGQGALVIDGKLKSKQWFMGMPASDKDLPLPELALVYGVSDMASLKKAFEEYRSIINDTLAIVNNATGGFFPDLKLPEPTTKKVEGGMVYFYPIPPFVGLDAKLLPNAGLSNNVMTLSLSIEHSERLLAKTPLKSNGLLSDPDRPLAGAIYFNWASFWEMLRPWAEYGINAAYAAHEGQMPIDKDSMIKHVATVIEVFQVIRTVTSISYFEGPVLVTRTETIILDLP